ncbi:selenoprotein W family protein [Nannizzia gypsea CBS 118893]|uniref:Selenoprotein W family protein n=1 Tax=Arthroderma gypseum (strain ATCC MYA-4604 / CBS 118893) TaxID=535722 RepID=E4V019_ARTGP|nr:selenoprotein W family protein [Nannizzia gypsea CBS 118893]EFR02956.1 selenoprotein W family protein [Nannizzia gypsea CBS 118893]
MDDQPQPLEDDLIADSHATAPVNLPRVTITFCTQCKWMLRAAYFAQELLSTFSTALGEVSLVPGTGGVFTVTIQHASNVNFTTHTSVLWDRKVNGGFPETKQLKALVRDVIEPSRDLGHIDRALAKERGDDGQGQEQEQEQGEEREKGQTGESQGGQGSCEECKEEKEVESVLSSVSVRVKKLI